MFMTLTGELSWQRLRRSAVDFYSKKRKNRSLSHPFGHLGVTYTLRLWLVRKPLVDFIFVVIELFSLSPIRLRRYERKSVEVGVFRMGCVTLSADFRRRKGASPTNHSWYQSNRVIALSCGIKIYAVRHLVLSQCTRVTDRRTDGQNYDSQDRPRICSRGKNRDSITHPAFLCIRYGTVLANTAVLSTRVRNTYRLFAGTCRPAIMLWRLFSIVECGIACFLCAMPVFEVGASSLSPRLSLCQISFLSRPPLLS